MGLFAAGQVVTLPFPHTDLSPGKLRPVLVLASAGRTDWIVCQITSNPTAEKAPIRLTQAEFENGSLPHTSYVRPSKLFTADEGQFVQMLGTVKRSVLDGARAATVRVVLDV